MLGLDEIGESMAHAHARYASVMAQNIRSTRKTNSCSSTINN